VEKWAILQARRHQAEKNAADLPAQFQPPLFRFGGDNLLS
jgi:hypothetical protein